MITVVEL